MNRLKTLLFALLILFLPSQLGIHFWPSWSLVNGVRVDYLSPTLYFTDILAILLTALSLPKIHVQKKQLVIFVSLMILNVVLSSLPLLSLYKWIKVIEVALLALVIFEQKNQFLPSVKQLLPYTLIWTALLAIAQWIHGGSLNGIFYFLGERRFTTATPGIALSKLFGTVSLRPYATLPHPNALAGFLVVGLLTLFATANFKTHKGTVFLGLLTTLLLFVLFLTESFGAWIALSGVLFFYLTTHFIKMSKDNLWRLFLIEVFLISLCSLPFMSLVKTPPLPFSNNVKERFELIYLSGLMDANHAFAGRGLGTFIPTIPQFTDKLPTLYTLHATSWLQPVHNVPLLLLSESGIAGVVALFLFLVSLPVSPAILFMMITSLFDHYWITLQSPSLLLAIVVGFTLQKRK